MAPQAPVPWPFESDTPPTTDQDAPLARLVARLRAYRYWVDNQARWAREAQQLHATAHMLAEGKAGRPRAAEATRDLAALRDSQIDPSVHRLLNAWPALTPEGLPPLEDHGDRVHWWLLENRPGHAPHTNGSHDPSGMPTPAPGHVIRIDANLARPQAIAHALAMALADAPTPATVDFAGLPDSGVAARVARRTWSLALGIQLGLPESARGLVCLNAEPTPVWADTALRRDTDRLEDAVLTHLAAHGHRT